MFVRTKRGADRLVKQLKRKGVSAAAMHGDMTQQARERALQRFEAGKVDVLVATDVAARGLDLDDITHVINYDPPEDDKGYVHRVGRTARAGRSGTSITLVTAEQQGDVSRMAARLDLAEEFEEEGMKVARRGWCSPGRTRRPSQRPAQAHASALSSAVAVSRRGRPATWRSTSGGASRGCRRAGTGREK